MLFTIFTERTVHDRGLGMLISGLYFSDELDHEGEVGVDCRCGGLYGVSKEDAEQLIAHLRAVFNLGDQEA